MTREEKIAAIYAEIANKEKTFGCKYIVDDGENRFIARETEGEELALGEDANTFVRGDDLAGETIRIHLIEIIGHPVMIGTIFERYSSSKGFINSQFILALVDKWTGYDKSIEGQSDECVDYIYSLIKK